MRVQRDEKQCLSEYTQAETECWSEQTQSEWGDCLGEGFVSVLPEKADLYLKQSDLSDVMGLWNQMSEYSRKNFSKRYGQIASLLFVKVEKQMMHAAVQFWDPSYRCFTFNQIDLTPTLEEYTALLGLEFHRPDKIFLKREKPEYAKNLSSILGIKREAFSAHIKKKGDHECLTKKFLCDFIQRHLEDEGGWAAFALAIYGLIIFPTVIGHIEVGVIDLFQGIRRHFNPVPAILAETFRSLNFCRRTGSARFRGCQQLLYVWLRSHLDSKQKAFIKPYSIPIQEFCEPEWPIAKSKMDLICFLKRLSEEQVVWMAPWMPQVSVLFRCGKMPWVPLLGLSGVIGYAPLMVLRQFGANQFVPTTHGLRELDYEYREPNAFERTKSILQMWKDTHRMIVGPLVDKDKVTPKYEIWRNQRVKDSVASSECFPRPISIVPPEPTLSEADLVMQRLETEKKEWEKEKSKLQETVSQLKSDAMVQEINISNLKRDRDMVQANLEELRKENKKLKIQSCEEKEMEIECLKAAVEFWKGKAKDNGQKLDNELQERQVLKEKYEQIYFDSLKLEIENKKLKAMIELETRENERLVHECQFKEEMYSKAVISMKEYQKRNEELEAQLNQN
ncbi:hypothetical protein PTKIN_Ptkin13bG0246800 [Pterospermum kingtungense]